MSGRVSRTMRRLNRSLRKRLSRKSRKSRASRKSRKSSASRKSRKSRKTRKQGRSKGKSPWLQHVGKVFAEMKKKDSSSTWTDALKEAPKTWTKQKQD